MTQDEQPLGAPDDVDLESGFVIGGITVWPRRELLSKDGEEIHLEPKVMQVLVELARNAQTLVSRDELLDRVWSDAVVGDEVLSRAVSLLRTNLGDERTNPRFIRTIPRQGYELVAEVEPLRAAKPRRTLFWGATALVGLVALAAATFFFLADTASRHTRLAILALQTDDPSLGPAAENLVDELIALASASTQVDTVAKRSTFAFRDPAIELASVASALDADHVLEGRLKRNGGKVSASLQLIDTASERVVWTDQVSAAEPNALGETVLPAVRSALNDHLAAGIEDLPRRALRPSDDAYDAYLTARHQWSLRGDRRIQRSIELLREAIALAPEFSDAYLALAQALALEPFYSNKDVEVQFDLAREQLAKAVAIDPALKTEADVMEGFMQYRLRNWAEAERLLVGALQIDPDNVLAHYWYAMLLSTLGDYDAALTHTARAAELDPLSSVLLDRLAIAYLWRNDLEQAREYFARAQEFGYIEGRESKAFLLYLVRSGQFDELRANMIGLGMPRDWVLAFAGALENPDDPGLRSDAVAATRTAIAAGQLPYLFHFGVWVMLGERDAAFDAFDFGLETVDIEFLWAEETAFLRESERFEKLLQQLGIETRQGLASAKSVDA
jgi:DNA-binding winged helix-turn-helix (wHTH) protein/TolB-like protein